LHGSGLNEKRIYKRIRSPEVLGRMRLPETFRFSDWEDEL
jgi:hypothetical protein